MFNFDGKVAIVTGSGSERGIGKATAEMLAGQGATVVLCDLNKDGVMKNVKSIQDAGG
ncbi:MAG: SDR family NAD(P)-dependent oxidoreductase, partial [Clostridiaceae bacterium]|nr:SDR family NAD(P)-dependent oxidoreductase [Clostridiaceae bacterium]